MGAALREVTVEMLRAELSAAEVKALPAVVAPQGGEAEAVAWLQERVVQACDRVVAAVNSCSNNRPIRTGLCRVPAGCVRTALVLARQAVIAAVPGMAETLEGGTRGAEYSAALTELHELAVCRLVPDYVLAEGELDEGAEGGMRAVWGERVSSWVF
jgi:hypothetical protein